MPAYDLGCDTCGHFWEEIRPMSESDAPSICPKCAGVGRRAWLTAPMGGARVVDHSGYHPGLARFPGDPQAHVDSTRHLNRVLDEKRREGRGVLDNT